MPDTNDLKSFKLSASILEDDGNNEDGHPQKKFVLKFQPTGRAESVADALVLATKHHKEKGKVVKVDLRHTEIEYPGGLSLYTAYISSDAVCQTCGAGRAEPTEWCHDPGADGKGGCEKFRQEGVKVKPRADTTEQMAKMASLLE